MPGEQEDDLTLDEGTPNEGLEAEADAADPDSQDPEVGSDAEGAAEGDGADAQEGQVDAATERRPTRGEARFQTLSKAAKDANERATRAETAARELTERIARLERPAQTAPQGPTAEQIALMTPDELIDFKLGTATKRFEAQLGQIQWQTYEATDKAAFEALKASHPMARRLADKVETRLAEMRAQGQNVDRVRLAKYLVGEEAWEKGEAAKVKQAAQGQRNIQRQTVRAGAARSDTTGNRGKVSDQEARDKRLENMTF